MAKRKITCNNTQCRHHCSGGKCDRPGIDIDSQGRCASFEKGLAYYTNKVWQKLAVSNFVTQVDVNLDPDLRVGLYCVMEIFGLGFTVREWGTSRIYSLVEKAGDTGLTRKQIIERPIRTEKMMELAKIIDAGMVPGLDLTLEGERMEFCQPKKTYQPFGWLSPTGDFTEGDFGEHEGVAAKIIAERGFYAEYSSAWKQHMITSRDFLAETKGYCLIHNPSGFGGYIVSHIKPLTKKQRDFLYGYFMDIGDRLKAEMYLGED